MSEEKNIPNKISFKCERGSNIIEINGEKKFLSIIIWDSKIKYEDIKDEIIG